MAWTGAGWLMGAGDEATGAKANGQGLTRLVNALRCSLAGFRSALRHEAAFRQELLLVALLAPTGLWLGEDGVERALLLGSLFLVLLAELLNTAIEAVVDRVGSDRHELSKRAKDVGSAAVLVALASVAAVWGLVLLG